MTAPPPKQIKVNCANKKRRPDEITARAAAMMQLKKIREDYALLSDEMRRKHEMKRVMYVYRCRLCDGWHLSSKGKPQWRVTEDDPYGMRQVERNDEQQRTEKTTNALERTDNK